MISSDLRSPYISSPSHKVDTLPNEEKKSDIQLIHEEKKSDIQFVSEAMREEPMLVIFNYPTSSLKKSVEPVIQSTQKTLQALVEDE
jgi:hypothetical protein